MNDDSGLNAILYKRAIPPCDSGLASRIIRAATRKEKTSLIDMIFQEMLTMMIVPRPAYALAVCLFLGLSLGLQIDSEAGMTPQDWFSFTDIEEGEWL